MTVSTTAFPKESGPRIRLRWPKSASGLAESLMPKVGQRGISPPGRSNTETGKFESIPPSTRIALPPAGDFHRTGRKNSGIEDETRTASAIRRRSGSRPSSAASRGSSRSFPAERSEAVTTRR